MGIFKFNEFDFIDSDYKFQSFQIAFQNLMLLFMKTYFFICAQICNRCLCKSNVEGVTATNYDMFSILNTYT